MPKIARHEPHSRDAPSSLDFVDGVLIRRVKTQFLELATANSRSTRATIVKTAWALTLAKLTGRDDVVFGSTGWGRNSPVAFAQDVMGSCTSHIPTRTRFRTRDEGGSSRSTYGEVVEQLQAQHIASMRFENVGANAIVEKCTPWKRSTRFSSLLIFQGLDIETPSRGGGTDGKHEEDAITAVKFTEIMDPGDRADVILHVEPFGEQTRVMMAFAKKNVPETVAGVMLQTFKRYLELITQSTDQPIDLGDGSSPPLLPVTCESVDANGVEGRDEYLTTDPRAEAVVKAVWTNVLGVNDPEFDRLRDEKESFLEVWGNTVSAAALAYEYKRNGLVVSTEDMLRRQTAQKQIEIISSMLGFVSKDSTALGSSM
ncbi:Nonribosomal peptide synthetase 1-like protein 4 [Colletotrichum chlorophyti]|uniref:Nonribosomal peptide synthetase 1-like protein 4 n=1 Tax=Colletotrichum chlorophyti TaxID=708187 RepID=A0A1Q8S8S8_9PEZI|nr:Nonribosomal peptide synthetase 1-like protein 4 [Colletotrichum chlorophyti]